MLVPQGPGGPPPMAGGPPQQGPPAMAAQMLMGPGGPPQGNPLAGMDPRQLAMILLSLLQSRGAGPNGPGRVGAPPPLVPPTALG